MSLASSIADAISTATADYQPDDMIDVLGLLVSNLPAIIAAIAGCSALVVAIRGQRKGKERWEGDRKVLNDVKVNTEAVRDEVKNEHIDDNLRHQLDRVEAAQKLAAAEQKRTNEQFAEMNRRQAEMNQRQADMRSRQIEHGRDINGLREDVGAVRDDMGGLRGELRDDRTNLREFKAGVNGFIKRVHPGEDPL
ncbi:hypothetical protein [Mycobacterium aquaticum]|uniref:Uncharacterized protein n=1 Tax=Mycobacterium aquaticum TaxID=1927124 RepID=A0A1X0A0I5_9MYCO|nr:hypothetical protein [Mycobacterium aquaticum]ORA23388.1 hypothetical protein BST13_35125 [Mycobacterium aquaticum]